MDKKIIIAIILILFSITGVFLLNRYGPSQVMLIPFGLMGISSVFFSRGILIFLTSLLLMVTQTTTPWMRAPIYHLLLAVRWVFFSLFALHVFGDIFLGRTVRKVKSFDIAAIIFIIYAFLSASYSPYPKLTLERATTVLFLYISVFWIIWKYAYTEGPERIIYLLRYALILILIASYAMIFIAPHRAFLLGRFRGIFVNPNAMGIICNLFLPIASWGFLKTRKKSALFLTFIILVSLLSSGSRNSLIALVISMGYFIYGRTKNYRPIIFLFSLSFILLLFWVAETLTKQFFMSYFRVKTIYTGGGRFELWPVALDLIMDKPILGYGFGVEETLLELKHMVSLQQIYGGLFHNSYLGITLQLGILGLIIFFAPLFILLFKELSLKRTGEVPLLRYALQTSLIAGLMNVFFESWLYSVGNAFAFPFWIMVMLLVFYRYQDKGKIIPEGT